VLDSLINLAWLLGLTAVGAGYLWWLAGRIERDAPSREYAGPASGRNQGIEMPAHYWNLVWLLGLVAAVVVFQLWLLRGIEKDAPPRE
jgi:hypothetical protein